MASVLPGSLKTLYKEAKNTVLQVPEIERKVKEATSNDKWGPTGTQMREIAKATHSYHELPLIMETIWRRLNDHGKYWRHVYKALLLVDYLLKNGSERVINECRENIIQIQTLTEFQHIDENDKDVGLSVRERAKTIVELIHDETRLKREREKAKSTSKKFSESMGSEHSDRRASYAYGESYDSDRRDRDREFNEDRERDRDRDFDRDTDRDRDREESSRKRYDSDEEKEEPQPRKSSSNTNISGSSKASSSSSSSSSTSVSRPRAPSKESVAPKTSNVGNVGSLLDLNDAHSAPQPDRRAQAAAFFSTPTTPSTPAFAAFGNTQPASTTFFNNNGYNASGSTSAPPPSAFAFDPREGFGNSANTGAVANTEWNDFAGNDQKTQDQQEDESKPKDPWAQKHLFDFDLNAKQSTSTPTSANKGVPMGALSATGKPTGMGMGMGATTTPKPTTAVYPTGGMTMSTQPSVGMMGGQPVMMGTQPVMMGAQPVMMGGQPVMMGGQPVMMGGQPVMGMGMGRGYVVQPGGMMYTAQPGMGMGVQPVMGMGTPSYVSPQQQQQGFKF